MSYILGLSAFYHDSSAAIIKDGLIIGAVQEERFTRLKHDSSFPKYSVKYLLKKNNLNINDIEYIIFYEKPFLKFERLIETTIATFPKSFKSFKKYMPLWIKDKIFQKKNIFNSLKEIDSTFINKKKIKFSEHHLSHASSAFFPSPFNEAIIITIDGVGEWVTASVSIGKNNKINRKYEQIFPHSLGLLYSAFTNFLGFRVNDGEYKMMGLAPYGKPIYEKIILDNIIDIKFDGSFLLNMKYFDYLNGEKMINENFEKLFNTKTRNSFDKICQFHMDVAASIQKITEKIIFNIANFCFEKYKIDNLCLSGGVALNCVANGKLLNKKIFKNIWIQPASGDAGGSIGSALGYWYMSLNNQRNNNANNDSMNYAYLGFENTDNEIRSFFDQNNISYKKYDDVNLFKFIAKEIINNKIVGWHQGKMEYGPRSLGNRSILANPLSSDMQTRLNLKTKFREDFRPFAPSILEEKVGDWFDLDMPSPYMLFVSTVNANKLINLNDKDKSRKGFDRLNIKSSIIPSVTHVDNTARVQTVNKNQNKKFYKLISEFEKISGCPILINTSFNLNNEPIVCNVEDSYQCFMSSDIDILVVENYVLVK